MYRLRFYLLLTVIYSCCSMGQGGVTTEKPVIIPVNPSSSDILPIVEGKESSVDDVAKHKTTTTEPTTTSTSTEPTTTSTSTEPTTTSTSTEPTTTSTSTEPTTTSTSAKPTTTSTAAPPAPTPKPGPLPPPEQGQWVFKDVETNYTCIVIQFAAQLNVTYNKVVENVTTLGHVIMNIPANATVAGGNCTGEEQWLTITWTLPITNISLPNNITVVFQSNKTSRNYLMKNFNISLSPDLFVNSTSKAPLDLYHGNEWMTPLSTSYRCMTQTRLNMSSESPSVVAGLTLTSLQEEAFRTSSNKDFSSARECGSGDVPDAVPIAVGCALGGLVVVVLIAYLVARRRSAARGYLSM